MDIDSQIKAQQEARKAQNNFKEQKVNIENIQYDTDIYDTSNKYEGYDTSLPIAFSESDDQSISSMGSKSSLLNSYTAPKNLLKEMHDMDVDEDETHIISERKNQKIIANRENEYQSKRFNREISPERSDAFSNNKSSTSRNYAEIIHENQLDQEKQDVLQQIREKESEKRNRWDETPKDDDFKKNEKNSNRWDETPQASNLNLSTPVQTPGKRARSRWDETPVNTYGATPVGGSLLTPTPSGIKIPQTPLAQQLVRTESDIEARNKPLTDEDLDSMLPSAGYKILEPPPTYQPINTPARKLQATPTPMGNEGFTMEQDDGQKAIQVTQIVNEGNSELPYFKTDDLQFFSKLLDETDEQELSVEELKERKIMKLLIRIKNGTPPMRKSSLRLITEKARDFGAKALFNQILPLLMSPTLEDQERHLLVKVIDRIMFKLDDLVRPYVHKILVVIEPMLIDEDYYARMEGREIISNLSKAAGLATMIATMRPDIDHVDEYVRNTTARAFSIVASALGVPALVPFLKAVCRSKKAWQARHTGIKIVQQIATLLGCGILPHLKSLVEIVHHGLEDEQHKVRTITALSIASLAEAAAPYGIESFDIVLKPLWTGIRKHRGKGLAAFLKAIGYIIPLMDSEYADYYTKEVMVILIREFSSPDEEMKKIVLKVIKQCTATEGVSPSYIKEEILPSFFQAFWVRRMALDRRNLKLVVETTVELASKVGVADILGRIVGDLKDDSEAYRKMVMMTIGQMVSEIGVADIDSRMEQLLIDGILFAFQEQALEDHVLLNGFGSVFNALGLRIKPYLQQAISMILWRLNNKSARVRQQAADLISKLAPVMRVCGEQKLMSNLALVLYEYLGEEYPDVLGSILGGLKAIVAVIGMEEMTPPIKDLLPRLTPILKNRHEKVQENCINLVGQIANRGAEFVSAREWMRICFELLDMLKAHRKSIRRSAILTFGYIAKAVGPQDVLATLLSNLKVQERQNRVCTTVAIAIVADTCAPFTVLPALMNEYRVPELNVQNGVLKSLSFLFEYIGEMAKDYIYAVTTLLEDALMDRDVVHRQTACSAVKHVALGVTGLGCEDALLHLFNFVWPNLFENSPHMILSAMEAIEALRLALGSHIIFLYLIQGLFHPARKVRDVYWRIYNFSFVANPQAFVPAFPRLESDEKNCYYRSELDYFI